MNTLDQVLAEMDADFLGSGEHSMSVKGLRDILAKGSENVVLLDVRTEREQEYVKFPCARNIPLSQLPDRLNELPKDAFLVAFCSSIFRSAVAYTYLRANGYDNVKGLAASMEDMIGIFKPGPLASM